MEVVAEVDAVDSHSEKEFSLGSNYNLGID